jgi:hypothetical protein
LSPEQYDDSHVKSFGVPGELYYLILSHINLSNTSYRGRCLHCIHLFLLSLAVIQIHHKLTSKNINSSTDGMSGPRNTFCIPKAVEPALLDTRNRQSTRLQYTIHSAIAVVEDDTGRGKADFTSLDLSQHRIDTQCLKDRCSEYLPYNLPHPVMVSMHATVLPKRRTAYDRRNRYREYDIGEEIGVSLSRFLRCRTPRVV